MLRQTLTKLGEQTSVAIVLRKIVELNFRRQKKAIREFLPLGSKDRVLDLGSGTGEFAPLFPVAQYEGIDIDPSNIAYAKRHYPHHFQVADALRLPFGEKSFTAILIVGVLHHLSIEECGRVLAEMKRVLAREGRVLIMEDTKSPRWITRLMHHLDQGAYIRTEEEWQKLFTSHFNVEKHWTFNNGVCFYSAFVLRHI
ncbi:MAG: class I SAM-dependent methyltransferase [bacterium]|nr:class I SAM-dependent methyltransferase [bacterium]